MFLLRVAAVLLLVSGVNGWTKLFNIFNNCHPPQTLVGKFCAAVLDNDVNGDGFVDNDDIDYDLLMYDRDGDVCTQKRNEIVIHWSCRYGWSSRYGHFMFDSFDNVKDGVITKADFNGPFKMSNAEFLDRQYRRFKDDYCSVPANRASWEDAELCRKVDELKPEDMKCRFV